MKKGDTLYEVTKQNGIVEHTILFEKDNYYVLDEFVLSSLTAVRKTQIGSIINGHTYFADYDTAKEKLSRITQALEAKVRAFKMQLKIKKIKQ